MEILQRYVLADKEIKLFYLSFFIAFSSVLSVIETLLPFKLPYMRLGLGNIVLLFFVTKGLYKETFVIGFVRVLLSSIATASLFSVGFLLSLSGTTLAIILMIGAHLFLKRNISLFSLSIFGAFAHISGQLLMALCLGLLVSTSSVYGVAPILSVIALIGGSITGFFALILYKRL